MINSVPKFKTFFVKFKKLSYVNHHLQLRSLCNKESAHNSQHVWDVVISGGGLVGSAMACALASSNIFTGKVLLLESSKKEEYIIPVDRYSNRVYAISPGSKKLFEDIGAWKKMCDLRVKEVKKMQVWESCSDAQITFQNPGMSSDIAYIVENDVILKALTERMNELNVEIYRIKACNLHLPKAEMAEHTHVTVQLEDNQTLETKLLIGADGANSLVRKSMGITYVKWNYDQKGIVATLKLSEPTENVVAWQRFLPTGPVALLPLSDDTCSLVWTVSLPMADKLMNMPDDEFVDTLNSFIWSDVNKNPLAESAIAGVNNLLSFISPKKGSYKQLPPSILYVEPNSRAAFPLGLGHATEYIAPRVALIGDSAHRIHPLAGQGVNLGFGDIRCLVKHLETSIYNGSDIGDMEQLLKYETERQRHNVPSMAAIDTLYRLYGTEFTPIVVLRSLGVTVLDSCDWLKERIIEHAAS